MPSFKSLIKKLFLAGYQLSEDAYSFLVSSSDASHIVDLILSSGSDKAIFSRSDIESLLSSPPSSPVPELDTSSSPSISSPSPSDLSLLEPSPLPSSSSSGSSLSSSSSRVHKSDLISSDFEILSSPFESLSNGTASGFRNYFLSRFSSILSIFKSRKDITNLINIQSLSSSSRRSEVNLVAIVRSKSITKKGTAILEIEDPTGVVTALVSFSSPSSPSLSKKILHVLEDSVLCFTGSYRSGKFFISDIKWPDIPFLHKPHHAYEDVFALFISDLHIGSKNFAGKLFGKLIEFINHSLDKPKLNLVSHKLKYIFVAGDIVDGVGIYPDQIRDLAFDSIHMQYYLAFELFEKLNSDVEIFIIPGNHDGARAAEPQTPILKDFASELYGLPYVHMLGSPAYIRVHDVDVLMSHGNALLDIAAAIPDITNISSVATMIETLRNRHLVPMYGKKTPIAPESEDRLVIKHIPDIYHTGHTHIAEDGDYKGITLINSGTLQFQTSYQKSMNIYPNTGVIYLVNLHTMQRTQIDLKDIF